jgi:hypothetical protein
MVPAQPRKPRRTRAKPPATNAERKPPPPRRKRFHQADQDDPNIQRRGVYDRDINLKVSEVLEPIMRAHGTFKQIAANAGVSTRSLEGWRKGETAWPLDGFIHVCTALGYKPDTILARAGLADRLIGVQGSIEMDRKLDDFARADLLEQYATLVADTEHRRRTRQVGT